MIHHCFTLRQGAFYNVSLTLLFFFSTFLGTLIGKEKRFWVLFYSFFFLILNTDGRPLPGFNVRRQLDWCSRRCLETTCLRYRPARPATTNLHRARARLSCTVYVPFFFLAAHFSLSEHSLVYAKSLPRSSSFSFRAMTFPAG